MIESGLVGQESLCWAGLVRTILEVELHSWAVGRFAHPYIEVFTLPRFEEQDVVAVVEFGEFIELVEFGLGIELCIFTAVRQERVKVVQEVSMSVGYASRGKN